MKTPQAKNTPGTRDEWRAAFKAYAERRRVTSTPFKAFRCGNGSKCQPVVDIQDPHAVTDRAFNPTRRHKLGHPWNRGFPNVKRIAAMATCEKGRKRKGQQADESR